MAKSHLHKSLNSFIIFLLGNTVRIDNFQSKSLSVQKKIIEVANNIDGFNDFQLVTIKNREMAVFYFSTRTESEEFKNKIDKVV